MFYSKDKLQKGVSKPDGRANRTKQTRHCAICHSRNSVTPFAAEHSLNFMASLNFMKETTCKETTTMIHLSIRKIISAKVVR